MKAFALALTLPLLAGLAGCVEEALPHYSYATTEQIAADPEALGSLVKSITRFTTATMSYGVDSWYSDAGFPGLMIFRDAMCEDIPQSGSTYNYYSQCEAATEKRGIQYYYYYVFLEKINNVLRTLDLENIESETARNYVGILLGHRACIYLDASRMFEYKKTGYAVLDDEAEASGIYGLTIPLVDEKELTVTEMIQNPRVPFYTMNRFILRDLDLAEKYLEGYSRDKISYMNQSVIWGFKARFYLDLATRFEDNPADLSAQLAAEGSDDGYSDLGIKTAQDCWRLAQEYSQKVMDAGYVPMTKSEWTDPTAGFNTPNNSWIWGSYVTNESEIQSKWFAYFSVMASESSWGFPYYSCYRCISKKLYDMIDPNDWRYRSWVNPDEAGSARNFKNYISNMTAVEFKDLPKYCNLKFRVRDLTSYLTGLVACLPYMRVEEMYLINAECKYHTEGLGPAVRALDSFVNKYRWEEEATSPYACGAEDYESFIKSLMIQKRIEFWGEGVVYFDYKRLRLQIDRAYTDTNYQSNYRFKTFAGYVAPWMNCHFSDYAESMKGGEFHGNPNFAGIVTPQ